MRSDFGLCGVLTTTFLDTSPNFAAGMGVRVVGGDKPSNVFKLFHETAASGICSVKAHRTP